MKQLKVLVGIPSGTHWLAQFGVDLVSMTGYFMGRRIEGFRQELRVSNVRSSVLPNNRLNIMKAAKALEVDYLLFLDCDHTFPPDMLNRLVAHEKDVVAANCVTKQMPAQPTGRYFNPDDPQGIPVYTDDKTGLEEIWRIGTGVMLLSKKVIETIPYDSWSMYYKSEGESYQGEDWTFCEALHKHGFQIYVDHDVSRQVGHIGNFEYTHQWVGEVQSA